MSSKMLINAVEAEEYRVAIIKNGLLDGFYMDTSTAEQKIGNIYKGIVERIQGDEQAGPGRALRSQLPQGWSEEYGNTGRPR